MAEAIYNQFCPVAMAAELLCTKWTIVLLRELGAGSTRFNELRRGLPRVSPALLSKRLKDLECAGVVQRTPIVKEPNTFEYKLTEAGLELRPIVEAVGVWGQRWIESKLALSNLDPHLLMWDMRRRIDPDPLPKRRCTIEVTFEDLRAANRWWLIVEPNKPVDLCSIDPGFPVDLHIVTDLKTMTEIWMGYTSLARARETNDLITIGSKQLEKSVGKWLQLSPFSKVAREVQ